MRLDLRTIAPENVTFSLEVAATLPLWDRPSSPPPELLAMSRHGGEVRATPTERIDFFEVNEIYAPE